MMCRVKRSVGRTATAAIGLVAGSHLLMSDTSAEPAPGENISEARKGGELTQVVNGAAKVAIADDEVEAQETDTEVEKQHAGTSTRRARPARRVKEKEDLFLPDPQYNRKYDHQEQVEIYGSKIAVEPPRPPVELGRQQYTSGIYDESSTILGEKNPLLPGLAIYGDWRTAVAYNNNNGKDIAQIATRLNIDVDLKITDGRSGPPRG